MSLFLHKIRKTWLITDLLTTATPQRDLKHSACDPLDPKQHFRKITGKGRELSVETFALNHKPRKQQVAYSFLISLFLSFTQHFYYNYFYYHYYCGIEHWWYCKYICLMTSLKYPFHNATSTNHVVLNENYQLFKCGQIWTSLYV